MIVEDEMPVQGAEVGEPVLLRIEVVKDQRSLKSIFAINTLRVVGIGLSEAKMLIESAMVGEETTIVVPNVAGYGLFVAEMHKFGFVVTATPAS